MIIRAKFWQRNCDSDTKIICGRTGKEKFLQEITEYEKLIGGSDRKTGYMGPG